MAGTSNHILPNKYDLVILLESHLTFDLLDNINIR